MPAKFTNTEQIPTEKRGWWYLLLQAFLMFVRRQKVVLHYPTSTKVGEIPDFKLRVFEVVKVRDLVVDPLQPLEFYRRPLVARGRWMVTAFDQQLQKFRNFYPANSLEFATASELRVGLYESDGNKPLEIISRSFGNSIRERILLARTVKKWNTDELGLHGLRLGIFADDLKLLSSYAG